MAKVCQVFCISQEDFYVYAFFINGNGVKLWHIAKKKRENYIDLVAVVQRQKKYP